MTKQLRIDFVSDMACPWCVVGLNGLLLALDAIGPEVSARIRLHPFELNPHMAAEGENTFEHVQKKYGSTQERSAQARQALREAGARVGFTFNYSPETRIWNTFDAHRLLHWASLEGDQLALKEALFEANFTDQAPMNDANVLADCAAAAGLDRAQALEVLRSGRYAEEVRQEEHFWTSRGINAVPSVVIEGKYLIQGGQPPQAFEQALRQILAQVPDQATA
jgi:predicted DsbA family dithiol-disulfide isomerase